MLNPFLKYRKQELQTGQFFFFFFEEMLHCFKVLKIISNTNLSGYRLTAELKENDVHSQKKNQLERGQAPTRSVTMPKGST